MARTGEQPDRRHSRERRGETQDHTQDNVTRCSSVLATLDQSQRLGAERRESGEAAAKPDYEECAQLWRHLHVEELAQEDSDQEAPGDVDEHRSDGEAASARSLHRPANQIAENRPRRAPDCD